MVPGVALRVLWGRTGAEKGSHRFLQARRERVDEGGKASRLGTLRPVHQVGETLNAQIHCLVEVEWEGKPLSHVAVKVGTVRREEEVKSPVCEKSVQMATPFQ